MMPGGCDHGTLRAEIDDAGISMFEHRECGGYGVWEILDGMWQYQHGRCGPEVKRNAHT